MRSRITATALAMVAASACVLGLAPTPASAAGMRGAGTATHPLRVTVGTLGAIGSLDPRQGNGVIAREVWKLQYPTLTALDPKTLDPAPGLAAAWMPAPGGHGWVYTLRKRLAWSDGQPVTADDVVFSLDHARDEHWPYAANVLSGLKARALDGRTVQVTSTGRKNPPPGLLLHVVPAHEFSSAPDIDSDIAKLGVSDGTWHVVSKSRDSVELDATAGPSGPALQQIVFRTYPNDDSLIDALARGKVDVVSGLPAVDVSRLEALPRATVDHASDGTEYVLRLVSVPGARVRQAVSLAIDRTALVADAVHGVGTPAAVEAQPNQAEKDLVARNLTRNTPLTIAIPADATSRRVGTLVRNDLSAAGLNTRVVDPDTGNVRPDIALERVEGGDTTADMVELFTPDTLQAFRSDNVNGWLPEPQQRRLVVFGPTVAQYGELVAAGAPPGEASSNGVYALGALIVLAFCGALYWIASRIRHRSVPSEETDAHS